MSWYSWSKLPSFYWKIPVFSYLFYASIGIPYFIQGRSPAFGPCLSLCEPVGVSASKESAVDLIHMCLQQLMATYLPLLFFYTLLCWNSNHLIHQYCCSYRLIRKLRTSETTQTISQWLAMYRKSLLMYGGDSTRWDIDNRWVRLCSV